MEGVECFTRIAQIAQMKTLRFHADLADHAEGCRWSFTRIARMEGVECFTRIARIARMLAMKNQPMALAVGLKAAHPSEKREPSYEASVYRRLKPNTVCFLG